MSKTSYTVPDYHTWHRDDLITETTRLVIAAQDAEEQGGHPLALFKKEAYHTAMAALIALTQPFDDAAALRAIETRHSHLANAAQCRALRLGLEEPV